MLRRTLALLGLCVIVPAGAADTPEPKAPRDLFLGEAFYYARQGEYFDAVSRLDTELQQFHRLDDPTRDPLHFHLDHAEFSVGDFELNYRMHQRAGRALRAVMEGKVSQDIKDEAAYRLARIYHEKGEKENALDAIERVKGPLPGALRDEERLLRAQIYIVNGRFSDAIKILDDLKGVPGYEGFANYNLGIALLQKGQEKEGLAQLDKAGQLESSDTAAQAIRDKANLVLGYRLMEAKQAESATQYMDRVRLDGPFSDKALLGSGWSEVAQGHFDRALVPWTLLAKRNPTDKSVQESLLGVPYAYAKLNLHGRAALLYGSALDAFGKELERLKTSVDSIKGGNFLKALLREELKQDSNWVVQLRELPDAPETWYLTELMASNDFQSALQNYRDLDDLRQRLVAWDQNLDAFEEMIALRRRYYEPLLPDVDKRFRVLDSQIRLRMEQRASLDQRLRHLLVAPHPETLATADERLAREQLARLDERYKNDSSPAGAEARQRIARLKGVIHWDIDTGYDQRLTEAWQHLRELDTDVARLQAIYASYVRTRQAATQSYQGYDRQIAQERTRIREAREKLTTLMAGQGHMLETMAINELDQRRNRLEQYQVQARFAMAESYDRALKAQQHAEVGAK